MNTEAREENKEHEETEEERRMRDERFVEKFFTERELIVKFDYTSNSHEQNAQAWYEAVEHCQYINTTMLDSQYPTLTHRKQIVPTSTKQTLSPQKTKPPTRRPYPMPGSFAAKRIPGLPSPPPSIDDC